MNNDLYLLYLVMLFGKCLIQQEENYYNITYELNCAASITHGHFKFDVSNNKILKNKETLEWFMRKFLQNK